jgi:Tfp pilus assembly protein PilF
MKAIVISFILLFFTNFNLFSQSMIDGKLYPDLLWGEGDETSSEFNNGGFIRIPEDFIITTGKLWQGEPPKSQGSFLFKEETIENSGIFNNRIVNLLLTGKKEDRENAELMFKSGINFDPRFFPFRYNYGRMLQLDRRYDEAITQFEFAKAEIPNFYKTYIHLGILSQLKNETNYALLSYKKSVELNPHNTEALVILADYYLEKGLRNRAKIYLNMALKIDEDSPNARLGLARLEINAGNHYRAYKILNDTQLTSPEGKTKDYDKKYHFYFAETASQVLDYETSENQYNVLLGFPNDPFFANFSYKVIQRRRDISKKFSEAKKTQLEEDLIDEKKKSK